MFTVEMLPAAHGDSLWVEYGDPAAPRRIIIDGGPFYAYPAMFERISALAPDQRNFELLVITHIDADHVEGSIRLLRDAVALGCSFKRIWFNGHAELELLPAVDTQQGALGGEYLSLVISDYQTATGTQVHNQDLATPWVGLAADGAMPVVELDGGLRLTIVSPSVSKLAAMASRWERELAAAGVEQGNRSDALFRLRLQADSRLRGLVDPDPDTNQGAVAAPTAAPDPEELGGDRSPANGSSIAFLAEHPDGSALLVGDAHADVLADAVAALCVDRTQERLAVDMFKLSHHGSPGNITVELLDLLSVDEYLISTNGAIFGHPVGLCLDTVLACHDPTRGPARLRFNYRSPSTRPWLDLPDATNATNQPFIATADPGIPWRIG